MQFYNSVLKRRLICSNEVPVQGIIICSHQLISYDQLPFPVNNKGKKWLVLYLPQIFYRRLDCSFVNFHLISCKKVFTDIWRVFCYVRGSELNHQRKVSTKIVRNLLPLQEEWNSEVRKQILRKIVENLASFLAQRSYKVKLFHRRQPIVLVQKTNQ